MRLSITHRSVQRRGFRSRFRQVTIERALDQLLARDEIRFDVHVCECSMLATGRCAGLIIQHRASRIQHWKFDVLLFQRFSAASVVAMGLVRMARNAPRSKMAALQIWA